MGLAENQQFYRDVADLLQKWGWEPEFYPGWTTRTNGSAVRTPTAATVHHTGGYATSTAYLVNPTDRPELVVLANVHITRNHRIIVLAAGSASHGGYTHKACYDRVVNGTAPLDRDLVPGADSKTFSINTYTIGIEVDGPGGSQEWDDWMFRATLAFCAAANIVGKWMIDGKNARVGGHKEHTKRKPGDPYMSMGELRTLVGAAVTSGLPVPPPGVEPPTTTTTTTAPVVTTTTTTEPPVTTTTTTPAPTTTTTTTVKIPKFPLPKGYYFGPKDGPKESVSGYYHTQADGTKGHDGLQLAQEQLKALGYLSGKPDGLYGSDTNQAAKKAQIAANKRGAGLQVDGLIGESTWPWLWTLQSGATTTTTTTQKPTTTTTTTKNPGGDVDFRFGLAAQRAKRWGGTDNYDQKAAEVKEILNPSLLAVTETEPKMLQALLKVFGSSWDSRSHRGGYIRFLFDTRKWEVRAVKNYMAPDTVHGGLLVPVVNKTNGLGMDVLVIHPRPSSVASETQKATDIRNSLALLGTWPRIVTGDMNMDADKLMAAQNLYRASPKQDSVDGSGKIQYYDAIYLDKGDAAKVVARASSMHEAKWSDHDYVLGNLTGKG